MRVKSYVLLIHIRLRRWIVIGCEGLVAFVVAGGQDDVDGARADRGRRWRQVGVAIGQRRHDAARGLDEDEFFGWAVAFGGGSLSETRVDAGGAVPLVVGECRNFEEDFGDHDGVVALAGQRGLERVLDKEGLLSREFVGGGRRRRGGQTVARLLES
jgi:hypothetical protein